MSKRSDGPGTHTSIVEITNVSKHGFWLILEERDADLAVDSIDRPGDYPLVSKAGLAR